MAAVAFQFTVGQETFTPAAAPQPAPAQPPANANEAQGAPTPEAIVPLATQVAEDQQAQQGTNPGQNQLAAFFLADAALFNPNATAAAENQAAPANTVPTQAPVNLAQTRDANAATAQAAPPAAQTANANTGAPAAVQTPAEELTQLDQTLQSIGVNPQGISLFSRMAMLLFANNPAALSLLVQNLQQATQGAGGTGAANAGAANAPQAANNAAQAPPAAPALVQLAPQIPTGQAQQPAAPQLPQITGQAANAVPPDQFPPPQTAPNAPPLAAAAAAGAGTSGTNTAGTSAGAAPAPTPQFAVFQLTFAAINEQLALQNNEAAAGDFGVNAPAQAVLNVSA